LSKAFVQESDSPEEEDAPPPPPSGGKHYITPAGYARLRDEYQQLFSVERPAVVEVVSWAAGNGDRSENGDYLYGKKRLREIDRRLRFLGRRLRDLTVVDPRQQPDKTRTFFGASVTYVDEADKERTVTIVGEDEVDPANGLVSFISPVARALMRTRVGDTVTLHTPRGPQEIEVLAIRYD